MLHLRIFATIELYMWEYKEANMTSGHNSYGKVENRNNESMTASISEIMKW